MKLAASLITILLASSSVNAETNVLYETGWETAPAPGWVQGGINGQNGWLATSASGFQVVSNTSSGATIGSQNVTTPYGKQFVRLTANPSTAGSTNRYGWTDLSQAFATRPSGENLIKASFDVFVPSTQASDGSWYGVRAFHENSIPWGVFVEADDQSVNLIFGTATGYSIFYFDSLFDYDTWFNVAVYADYATGDLSVYMDGVSLDLTANTSFILSGSLQDVDLWSYNPIAMPALRVVFIDNYSVTTEGVTAPPPTPILTITANPIIINDPPTYHLSWSGDYFDWILESTHRLEPVSSDTIWTPEGGIASVFGGVASLDVVGSEAPVHTFFRLRKP